MTTILLWGQLLAAAGIILVASRFLAGSADVISYRTGIGRSFIGVIMLATATSLPELGTGISSVTLVDAPDLAAGNVFGANLFNLCIIGLLDMVWRDGPILNSVSLTSIVVGAMGVIAISLAIIAIFVHGMTPLMSAWPISPVSVAMLVAFVLGMSMTFRHERDHVAEDAARAQPSYAEVGLARALLTYLAAAAVLVSTAVWLANTGEALADQMAWHDSFVGTQFLALCTTLPEFSTSVAAVRLKAPDLAISNLLGSNLFNVGVVLFLDDLLYSPGLLWTNISLVHGLTGVIAILMTNVVVLALLARPRARPWRFWTVEAALLVLLYVAASFMAFNLG